MNLFKKIAILIILSVIFVGAFTFDTQVNAIAGSQFNAGRIVDDVVFFSANTMSVADIQNFLNSKVPSCDTWHTSTGPNNQPPFTCLKDYSQSVQSKAVDPGLCNGITAGTKTAAQIFYEVGQSCGVNPQALIVLVQKEESLVTDTWPWNSQYQTAAGYGCPDTSSCDSTYYGFFNQVYAAARQFRYYANNPSQFNYRMGRNNYIPYNPDTNCGGSSVYLQDQATAGLYNYTPYQPNAAALNNLYGSGDSCSAYGNRNFWRLFNDWFGASVIGAVPSPLYKSSNTQSIYVIAGGSKFLVPSPDILQAYGLAKFPAALVDDSFLNQYPTGDSLTTIGKKQYDPSGTFYLFDDGKRYPVDISACAKFPDGTTNTTTTWGLDCFNSSISKTLANELVDIYTAQDEQLPKIVLNQGAAWLMDGGKKRRITYPGFIDANGGWGQTRWMQNANMTDPDGKMIIHDNTLVKFDNGPTLYVFAGDKLYPVPGPGEYSSWGLNRQPGQTFPASFNTSDPLTVAPNLTFFARSANNTPFMMLSNGTKVSLAEKEADWPNAQYSYVPDSTLGNTPTVPLSSVFRSDSGTIFSVTAGKKYIYPTPDDFFYLHHTQNELQPVSGGLEATLTYDGMLLSPGRLFKVAGSDTIHYVYDANSSLSVGSTNFSGLPYNKLITVDATTGNRYPVIGAYHQ